MEHDENENLRVRDLFRQGLLPLRPAPCHRTTDRLMARSWRRPVGCTARLFSKFPVDDPFLLPDETPEGGHKTVYAAGRFVRLKDEEKPKSELDKLREQAQNQPRPKRVATPDRPVHSPSASRPAPEPPTRRKPPVQPAPARKPTPEPEPPPEAPKRANAAAPRRRAPPQNKPQVTRSGRIRTAPARGRKPQVKAPPLPVRPDIDQVREKAAPAPPRRRETAPPVRRPAVPIPRRPEAEPEKPKSLLDDPRFTGRPSSSPAPPPDKWKDQQKPTPTPTPKAQASPPPRPAPKPAPKPAPRAPTRPAGGSDPDSLKHPLMSKPGGGKPLQGNAVVKKRAAPQPEPEPESTTRSKPVDRRPPTVGGGGGGGLDDLFGAPSEGRVRVGRARRKAEPEVKEAPPSAARAPSPAPSPSAPKGEADSLQHELAFLPGGGKPRQGNAVVRKRAAPPPQPEREPEPDKPARTKPVDRRPPTVGGGGGGGLDDLFGAPSEGRVRIGRPRKRTDD